MYKNKADTIWTSENIFQYKDQHSMFYKHKELKYNTVRNATTIGCPSDN